MTEIYNCTCGWIGIEVTLHKNEALWNYAGIWKVCEYGVRQTNPVETAGPVEGEAETTSGTSTEELSGCVQSIYGDIHQRIE